MDINDLRSIGTLLVFTSFIGICLWAFSSKKKASFEEAANLPFADDEPATQQEPTPVNQQQ